MVAGAVSDATDWANPGVSQLWATTTTKMQIFGQKKQNSSVWHNTAADETAAVTDGKRGEGQKAIRQQNQVMRNDCASRQTDRQTDRRWCTCSVAVMLAAGREDAQQ